MFLLAAAISPSNPKVQYASIFKHGSPFEGSLFRIEDGQAEDIGQSLPRLAVALAIDPKNEDTVYAVSHAGGVYKTTDGGVTWSDEGGIDTASDPTDGWAGAMWYSQWTPGNTTGNLIYLAYTGDDVDEIEFNYINTSDDSSRGSWATVFDAGTADGGDGSPAICKATNDVLWAGGFGSTCGLYNSTDGGATWTSNKPGDKFDDDDDN